MSRNVHRPLAAVPNEAAGSALLLHTDKVRVQKVVLSKRCWVSRLGQLGQHGAAGGAAADLRPARRAVRCHLPGDGLAAVLFPGPGAGGGDAHLAPVPAGGVPGVAGEAEEAEARGSARPAFRFACFGRVANGRHSRQLDNCAVATTRHSCSRNNGRTVYDMQNTCNGGCRV